MQQWLDFYYTCQRLNEARRQSWWLFPTGTVRGRSSAFVCMRQKLQQRGDETTGAVSGNCHVRRGSRAIVFRWIGGTSFKCQSEHGTRSYGCITRGYRQSSIVSLCFVSAVVEKQTTAAAAVSKNSQRALDSWAAPSFGTPRWDSLRRGAPKSPRSGLGRPRPGRCAPSAWLNRPWDTAATTSTSPTPREPPATHPLTHRVCSRGQIGGKWGQHRRVKEFVLCVREDVTCVEWQMSTLRDSKRRGRAGEGRQPVAVEMIESCGVFFVWWNGLRIL